MISVPLKMQKMIRLGCKKMEFKHESQYNISAFLFNGISFNSTVIIEDICHFMSAADNATFESFYAESF